MNHQYVIKSERLILKPLSKENIEDLRKLRNRESRYFYSQNVISTGEQLNWFNNYLSKDGDLMFSIFHKNNLNEYIGSIALYDINMVNKKAEFGRIIVDKIKCPDKGIGSEAICALLKFAFHNLNLKKIIATAKFSNTKAIDIYKKIGFIECGKIDELEAYEFEITQEAFYQKGS